MKHLKFLILFLFINIWIAEGQELTNNGTPKHQRLGFSLAYYGDKISNPGVQLGLENYLSTTSNFNVIGSILATNYYLKNIYTALSVTPRIGMRYTTNFGLALESHLGFGYLQKWYNYNEYDVNSNGQVVNKGKASQISAMPNLAIGFGYDFRKKTKFPALFFGRSSINYNYPNKHFLFEASYAIEVGLIYVPNFNKKP